MKWKWQSYLQIEPTNEEKSKKNIFEYQIQILRSHALIGQLLNLEGDTWSMRRDSECQRISHCGHMSIYGNCSPPASLSLSSPPFLCWWRQPFSRLNPFECVFVCMCERERRDTVRQIIIWKDEQSLNVRGREGERERGRKRGERSNKWGRKGRGRVSWPTWERSEFTSAIASSVGYIFKAVTESDRDLFLDAVFKSGPSTKMMPKSWKSQNICSKIAARECTEREEREER